MTQSLSPSRGGVSLKVEGAEMNNHCEVKAHTHSSGASPKARPDPRGLASGRGRGPSNTHPDPLTAQAAPASLPELWHIHSSHPHLTSCPCPRKSTGGQRAGGSRRSQRKRCKKVGVGESSVLEEGRETNLSEPDFVLDTTRALSHPLLTPPCPSNIPEGDIRVSNLGTQRQAQHGFVASQMLHSKWESQDTDARLPESREE